jgi:D-psicose/D-tagatose/L-ribulose 3-epimerase
VKLGMNMLLWSFDVTDPGFHETFELLAQAGFDGIEVPVFALDPEPYAKLGERLAALGLERTALSAPGFDSNPISQDPSERRRAIERNARSLECAAAAGATILAGTFQATPTVFSGAPPTAAEFSWATAALRAMAEAADPLGRSTTSSTT